MQKVQIAKTQRTLLARREITLNMGPEPAVRGRMLRPHVERHLRAVEQRSLSCGDFYLMHLLYRARSLSLWERVRVRALVRRLNPSPRPSPKGRGSSEASYWLLPRSEHNNRSRSMVRSRVQSLSLRLFPSSRAISRAVIEPHSLCSRHFAAS